MRVLLYLSELKQSVYVPLLKLNFIVCLCSQQFWQFSKCLTKEYVANTLFSN